MDTLQDLVQRELSTGLIATVLTDMLSKKFIEQGITLSERQKQKLQRQIEFANEDLSNLTFTIESWRFWEKRKVNIEFTDKTMSKTFSEL